MPMPLPICLIWKRIPGRFAQYSFEAQAHVIGQITTNLRIQPMNFRSLMFAGVAAFGLVSCGGGGGDSGGGGSNSPPPAVAPKIVALVLSFPTGAIPPGFIVGATANTAVAVQIVDQTGSPITSAGVTVNGTTATYVDASSDYEAYIALNPGDPVSFSASVGGHTYTQTGSQFLTYPVITSPVSGTTWSNQAVNQISWSGVANSGTSHVALGMWDTSGNFVWPSDGLQVVAPVPSNFRIDANTLGLGDRYLLVGLIDQATINNAASGSALLIGGFNYASLTINSVSQTLSSITCNPTVGAVSAGKTRQLQVEGTYTDNHTADVTGQVTWSSSVESVATVSAAGAVTGVTTGTTQITADANGLQCHVNMEVFQPTISPSAPLTESTTFRVDYAHSGSATLGGPTPTFPPSATWFHTLDGYVSYPVVGGGMVFVTTNNDGNPTDHTASVFALDLATGNTVWGPIKLQSSNNVANATYADGTLYVVTYDGIVDALDGATGNSNWSQSLGQGSFDGPPNVVNGILYAAGSTGMVAVNATNGHILWQSEADDMTHISPTVATDGVYVSAVCDTNKYDPVSGEIIWQVVKDCVAGSTWTSVYADALLYSYNPSHPPSYSMLNAVTAAAAGNDATALMPAINSLYSVSVDDQNKVTVVDRVSGNTLWTDSSIGNLLIDPLLIDHVLFTADVFGTVYARDASAGTLLWSGSAGSQMNPATWASGGLLPAMGVGDGWLIVPADHSIRAWKLVP